MKSTESGTKLPGWPFLSFLNTSMYAWLDEFVHFVSKGQIYLLFNKQRQINSGFRYPIYS